MTTLSFTSAPSLATNAAYQAWGKSIHDALVAIGLVQTADTGQANWATAVLGAATTNTVYHYEVWRFNDALQATAPILLKIEYGRGTSPTNDVPTLWLTVGRTSNGAGVLSNLWRDRQIVLGTISITAFGGPTVYTCYASYSEALVLALNTNHNPASASTSTMFLAVERSRDASGAMTGEAVAVSSNCAGYRATTVQGAVGAFGVAQSSSYPALGFLPSTNGNTPVVGLLTNSVGASKDPQAITVAPIALGAPGVTSWNSHAMMWVHPGDAVFGPLITILRHGEPHAYRMVSAVYTGTSGPLVVSPTTASAGNAMPAMVWD